MTEIDKVVDKIIDDLEADKLNEGNKNKTTETKPKPTRKKEQPDYKPGETLPKRTESKASNIKVNDEGTGKTIIISEHHFILIFANSVAKETNLNVTDVIEALRNGEEIATERYLIFVKTDEPVTKIKKKD